MARKSRRTQRLRVVNPDCAGIDIGKDRHFVAVEAERHLLLKSLHLRGAPARSRE